MSVLERLKAFFLGAKKEVIENISEEEVLNQSKPEKTADLKSKQTYSNAEEKDSNTSSKKDETESKTENNLESDGETIDIVELDSKIDDDDLESDEESLEKTESESKEENDDSDSKDEVENSELDEEESDEDINNKNDQKEKDNMTLLEETQNKLTAENIDKDFTQMFVDAGIDSVEHCFQCGTCTGGCPSGRRTPYRVRQLIRKCLLGLKDEVISDDALWMCTTCYTCQERCPREIKIVEIVKMARNAAAQAGFMAPAHKATGSFVIKTGHGVPINDATKELRKRVGLDELPPTTHSFPEALKEVQFITEATGFDDLIGYNTATGELE